ncbi:hypothetical protein BC938DRAFT_480503 [Jimgerdemannia flammicorona]|uniref:Uncharacterized protein n=1 Tax=Jimgerdemannia flammicorona TaxID=994334 RepID=A0A433QIE3_9FUNG|nr:hypothetical protein BC938DRAFT_480503 [Jimgerdemannia flammicorona]
MVACCGLRFTFDTSDDVLIVFLRPTSRGISHVAEQLTVDNTSDSPIIIHLSRVSLNAKNENTRSLLFSLVSDVQKRGCRIGAEDNAQALENQRLEAELERFKVGMDTDVDCTIQFVRAWNFAHTAIPLPPLTLCYPRPYPMTFRFIIHQLFFTRPQRECERLQRMLATQSAAMLAMGDSAALPGDLEFEGDEDEDEDEDEEME